MDDETAPLVLKDAFGTELKLPDGRVPPITEWRERGERWVTVGYSGEGHGLFEQISEAARTLGKDDYGTTDPRVPTLYDPTKPWRPYVPTGRRVAAPLDDPETWMFVVDWESLIPVVSTESVLPRAHVWLVQQIHRDYQTLVYLLNENNEELSKEWCRIHESWDSLDPDNLVGVDRITEGLAKVQYAFLDGLGILAYATARRDLALSTLTTDVVRDYEERWLLGLDPVGCVLDLSAQDLFSIPLTHWVAHGVPFSYQWHGLLPLTQEHLAGLCPGSLRARSPATPEPSASHTSRELTCYLAPYPGGEARLIAFRGPSASTLESLSCYAYDEELRHGWPVRTYYESSPSIAGASRNAPNSGVGLRTPTPMVITPPRSSSPEREAPLDDEQMNWLQRASVQCTNDLLRPTPDMPSLILDHGRWELTPLSELKLRYAAWKHALTTVEQVLQYGLANGIAFRIEIPLQIAQDRLLDATVHERPVWLRGDYRDPALTYFAQVREWRDHHEERACAVLQRSHAIAFLYRGGLLWRLALHYGGSHLISSLRSGLSDSAARYQHGRTRRLGYLSDDVSNSEIDILLGVTTRTVGRKTTQYSWWPRPEWLESRTHFSGQWSPGDERWFQARLKDIQDQVPRGAPKTAYQWQEALGRQGRAVVGDFVLPGQEEIKRTLRSLREQSETSWDGEKLADTSVPDVL